MSGSVSNPPHYALRLRADSTLDSRSRILLAVYAAVLLSVLGLTPLWVDEVLQFGNTRHSNLHELIRWVELNAGAVPLPYLFQRAVVNLLGYSAFVARIPAALCSVLSGIVFAALCPRFLERGGRVIALATFLVLPLQFRYGLEARGYSQGLLFSVLSLWLYLRLCDRPAVGLAALYGSGVALGLYSQPLTVFPVLAQVFTAERRARWHVWIAVVAAGTSFLPWYVAQHTAQTQQAAISKPTAFFSIHQIAPQVLLHDLSGGGYICTIALLALAGLGAWRSNRLLVATLAASLAGPILMDVVFNYFFAERQLLFAMPALVLLALHGVKRIRKEGRSPAAYLLLALFLGAALAKDFHLATVPKDDLAATADAIAARVRSGSCLLTAPQEQAAFYVFFRPDLQNKICGANLTEPEIVAVSSTYSTPAQRQALLDSLSARYEQKDAAKVGRSEIWIYRRH